jgi:hypothetical protein
LRNEERLIDNLPLAKLERLQTKISKDADEAGSQNEDVARTAALRLLAGWIASKCICRRSKNKKMIIEAQKHDKLHFDHIRNLLRILRGETPIIDD